MTAENAGRQTPASSDTLLDQVAEDEPGGLDRLRHRVRVPGDARPHATSMRPRALGCLAFERDAYPTLVRLAGEAAISSVDEFVHEQAMLSGTLPVAILRAAPFHELVGQLVDWGRQDDVSYVPTMRAQLVAARTVAEALADLAIGPEPDHEGSPATPTPEIGGPRAESVVEMATLLMRRRGDPVRVEGVSHPSDPDRELYLGDALLPGSHATLAGPTFEQWLANEEHSGN